MNLDLHSEINGSDDAPTIIILHGLFGSTSNWRSISRGLSDTNRVISLDLRNHGKSPWHGDMSYMDLAGDVAHFIETNGIESPAIVGHSMGGKTAMTLLQEFPLDLGRVFVIDIAPVRYFHDHDNYIEAMQSISFENIESRKQVEEQLAIRVSDPPVRSFLMQNLVRENGKYCWRINLDAIVNNMQIILDFNVKKVMNSEAVFVAGSQSNYILPDHRDAIKVNYPGALIETIDGAGHWLHAEKPLALLEVLNRYLNR